MGAGEWSVAVVMSGKRLDNLPGGSKKIRAGCPIDVFFQYPFYITEKQVVRVIS
jgi:hypothetical protein